MNQREPDDFVQVVLDYLETKPCLVMQAVEWLGNHFQLAKALVDHAPAISPEESLRELQRAGVTEDYAYLALLCLQRLRQHEAEP